MNASVPPFPRIKGQQQESDPSVALETQRMLGLYNFVVRQMSLRLGEARRFLSEAPTWVNVESAAQQLRHGLELVLVAGLVAHRTLAAEVREQLARHNKDAARKLVERLNPSWVPVRFEDGQADDGSRQVVPLAEGFLVADERGRAWSRASALLHARNPFGDAKGETLEQRHEEMIQLQNGLLPLLDQHYMALPDGTWFAAQ
ncbi:MAG: hypothetical protein QOD50_1131, partial [Actinomycetota bacterium]|nr:hypothetical protein [Actinomycetota bacterium]